jgi:hypothetical protein
MLFLERISFRSFRVWKKEVASITCSGRTILSARMELDLCRSIVTTECRKWPPVVCGSAGDQVSTKQASCGSTWVVKPQGLKVLVGTGHGGITWVSLGGGGAVPESCIAPWVAKPLGGGHCCATMTVGRSCTNVERLGGANNNSRNYSNNRNTKRISMAIEISITIKYQGRHDHAGCLHRRKNETDTNRLIRGVLWSC